MVNKKGMNRRDFIKAGVLAGIALPAKEVMGYTDGKEVVSSPDEYGGFYVRIYIK